MTKKLANARTFCIVGPIQADGDATHREPQAYRLQLSQVVQQELGGLEEFHPEQRVSDLANEFFALKPGPVDWTSEEGHRFRDAIVSEFLSATAQVGDCDLVVAYLPDGVLSMGTAMELYSAYLGGAVTVVIGSRIRENLAVAATADFFVESPQLLGPLLRDLICADQKAL